MSTAKMSPRRAFTIDVSVGGDTREDAIALLRHFLFELDSRGSNGPIVSGGYSSGGSVDVSHDPSITHDVFIEQIESHLAERRDEHPTVEHHPV